MNHIGRRGYPSVKIVLAGDSAVGKTSIRKKYMGQSFGGDYLATIGAEVSYAEVEKMDITIWDLAGDPNFEHVRLTFYAGSRAAILVFDLTRPHTFDAIPKWISELQKYTSSNIPVLIVGNKDDLIEDIESLELHHRFVRMLEELQDINLYRQPLYTSAKTGKNIKLLFNELEDMVLELL